MPWASVREMFKPEPPPPPTSSTDRVQQRFSQAINSMRNNPSHATTQIESTVGMSLPAKDSCCPNLTFKQRVQGCLGCAAAGMGFSFLGFTLWWTGHIAGESPKASPPALAAVGAIIPHHCHRRLRAHVHAWQPDLDCWHGFSLRSQAAVPLNVCLETVCGAHESGRCACCTCGVRLAMGAHG
jgi:hypothetical protein